MQGVGLQLFQYPNFLPTPATTLPVSHWYWTLTQVDSKHLCGRVMDAKLVKAIPHLSVCMVSVQFQVNTAKAQEAWRIAVLASNSHGQALISDTKFSIPGIRSTIWASTLYTTSTVIS